MFSVAVVLFCLAAGLPGLTEAIVCSGPNGFAPSGDPAVCDVYFQCENGEVFRRRCPKGLAFSSITNDCEWPDESPDCDASAYLNFNCPHIPNDPPRYPVPGDCHSFFICVNSQPRLLGCERGTVFNPRSLHCQDISFVPECQ